MNHEVTVVARIVARADCADAMAAVLAGLVAPTRAEPGCIEYAFFRDAERPTHFLSVERWNGAEAAAAHMATPHVRGALAAAADWFAEPPQIRTYRPLRGTTQPSAATLSL